MLILNRQINERIVIRTRAGDIFIEVLDVRNLGGAVQVKVGVDAPSCFEVDREEIRMSKDATRLRT